MPLPVCNVCGKKMPPHILSVHMAKSHPTEYTQKEERKYKFDYESSYFCRLCNVDIPQILHEFHMHVKHGI